MFPSRLQVRVFSLPRKPWIGCIVKESTLGSCDREAAAWHVLCSTKVAARNSSGR
jgi:hypothetical protein